MKNKKIVMFAIASLLVLGIVASGIVISYNNFLVKKMWDNNVKTIEEIKVQQIYNFDIKLQGDIDNLETYAKLISSYHFEQGYDHLKDLFLELAENSHFEFFGFADTNGDVIAHDDETTNVADRIYFQKSLAGETRISRPLESRIFDKTKMMTVISTPLYSFENPTEILGVFFGAYNTEDLNDLLLSSMQGDNFAVVVTDIGEIIAVSKNDYYPDHIINVADFYEDKEIKLLEGDTSEEVAENLINNKKGYAIYSINGEEKILLYDNISTNNWNIFSITSKDSLTATSSQILRLSWILNITIAVTIILLFGFILYSQLQNAKKLQRSANYDKLTGLPNKEKFNKEIKKIIKAHPEESFACVIFDIAKFKLINDLYGVACGDKCLRNIAQVIKNYIKAEEKGSAYLARVHSDTFAVLMKRDEVYGGEKKKENFLEDCIEAIDFVGDFKIELYLGRYITKKNEKSEHVLEKALIAHSSARSDQTNQFVDYDDQFVETLKITNDILQSIDRAIAKKEIQPYFQPQYHGQTGAISGAELLVRWIKKEKVKYYPDQFIPILEKAGEISKLDAYLREEVCKSMRQWQDQGLSHPAISVNVSRIELLQEGFVENLVGVLDKYNLAHNLLNIEITETAYIDNSEALVEVVHKLKENGFRVEMDDFGSGHSSLNILKDIPVDIVKLDMKFVEVGADSPRSGSLLTSAVRLVQGINVETIAEGVETKEQADYLRSIGCDYLQGYYFAKPISKEQFELVLQGAAIYTKKEQPEHVSTLSMNFLDATAQETLLFNTFLGGAAILEYANRQAYVLRANDRFYEAFGEESTKEDIFNVNLFFRIVEEQKEVIIDHFESSIQTGREMSGEVQIFLRDQYLWQQYSIKMLVKKGNTHLFYLGLRNITERKKTELALKNKTDEIIQLHNNIPGAVFYAKNNDGFEVVYGNTGFFEFIGYTKEEFAAIHGSKMKGIIYQEDWQPMIETVTDQLSRGNNTKHIHRIVAKDGTPKWISIHTVLADNLEYGEVFYCTFVDVSAQKELEQHLTFYYASNIYQEMLDNTDTIFVVIEPTTHEILFANKAAKRLSVTKSDTYDDQKCYAYLFGYEEPCEFCRKAEADQSASSTFSVGEKSYEIIFQTINWKGKKACLKTITDRTNEAKQQEILKKLVEHAPGCISIFQIEGEEIVNRYLSNRARKLMAYKEWENPLEFSPVNPKKMVEQDCENLNRLIRESEKTKESFSVDLRYYMEGGGIFWLNLVVNVLVDEGEIYFYGLYTEVTKRKQLEESLALYKTELEFFLTGLHKYVLHYNIQTKTLLSPKEYAKRHFIPEKLENVPEVFEEMTWECGNEACNPMIMEFYESIIQGEKTGMIELPFVDAKGKERIELLEFSTIFDERGNPVKAIISVEDVTEDRAYIRNIEMQARFDGLTSTYNRATGETLIQEKMKEINYFAFLMIDLDHLKTINDTYGHGTGDEVIVEIAETIKRHFRDSDIIVRYGGDEFAAFLPNMNNKESLALHLQSLVAQVNQIRISEKDYASCSIGAVIGNRELDYITAYRNADKTLYEAKRAGKNTYKIME